MEQEGSTPQPSKPRKNGYLERLRIEYLLNRRRRIEDEREEIRSKAIARGLRLVSEILKPIVWLSVIPVYPWRDICKASTCYNHFRFSTYPTQGVQRIPDGGMFVSKVNLSTHGGTIREVISCDSKGHFLYIRGLVAVTHNDTTTYGIYRQEEITGKEFAFDSVKERLSNMIVEARKFYEKPEIEWPGLLSVEVGMSSTANIRLYDRNDSQGPKRFHDDTYHHQLTMTPEEFLSQAGSVNQFFDRIAFAFDVRTPEGQ